MRIAFCILALVLCGNAADENTPKTVVDVIQAKKEKTQQDQHRYLLALYHAGRFEEAVTFYENLNHKVVGKGTTLVYVRTLIELKRIADAYKVLKKLEDPKNPDIDIDYLRGLCMVKRREWQGAEKLLGLVVRLNPKHAYAQYYYAITCAALGRNQDAVDHLMAVWQLEPRDSFLARAAGKLLPPIMVAIQKENAAPSKEK